MAQSTRKNDFIYMYTFWTDLHTDRKDYKSQEDYVADFAKSTKIQQKRDNMLYNKFKKDLPRPPYPIAMKSEIHEYFKNKTKSMELLIIYLYLNDSHNVIRNGEMYTCDSYDEVLEFVYGFSDDFCVVHCVYE